MHEPLAKNWEGDIPDPQWLYFGASNTSGVIYLVPHEDDDAKVIDSAIRELTIKVGKPEMKH